MPEWPGGPCPECNEVMPPRVLRCRTCGANLNPDLQAAPLVAVDSVELQEITVTSELTPSGYFVGCPNCEQELRIAAKYLNHQVQCKFCSSPFLFVSKNATIRQIAIYGDCPHCRKELRIATKYLGRKVGCKFCDGAIRLVDRSSR
ncbi:MAG: hypothetical protein ACK5Q5_19810 [Planctomycetaceae bacterium]